MEASIDGGGGKRRHCVGEFIKKKYQKGVCDELFVRLWERVTDVRHCGGGGYEAVWEAWGWKGSVGSHLAVAVVLVVVTLLVSRLVILLV